MRRMALLPPQQESCVNIIRRIIELMPEEKGNGQCNNCQNSGGQSKNDKKNDDKDKKNDDKEQQNQDQKPDDKKDDGKDDEKEDDQKDGGQDDEQDDREIEAVLKKAQERNDEHEADKKLRARRARLPPPTVWGKVQVRSWGRARIRVTMP